MNGLRVQEQGGAFLKIVESIELMIADEMKKMVSSHWFDLKG